MFKNAKKKKKLKIILYIHRNEYEGTRLAKKMFHMSHNPCHSKNKCPTLLKTQAQTNNIIKSKDIYILRRTSTTNILIKCKYICTNVKSYVLSDIITCFVSLRLRYQIIVS